MTRIVVDIIDGKPVFCNKEQTDGCVILYDRNLGSAPYLMQMNPEIRKKIIFSNKKGVYIIKSQFSDEEILDETLIKGSGNFPYTFKKYYEAFESFKLFNNKQKVIKENNFELNKYLNYTFGIEYETSEGYVPEDICFRDGLIPLRDGSISGLEYSTVVMDNKSGLDLVYQQMETLRKYTFFNKECSLHMHLGGYPIDPLAIWTVYRVCYYLQEEMEEFLPKYTYKTSCYKKSGKDYCNKLGNYKTFNDLYSHIAEQKFMGSLEQPHPYDCERNHKWDCHSRYVCVNFLNMLCYENAKTIEFRFLRPTMNFKKIYYWLAIFNAILKYSEELYKRSDKTEDSIMSLIFDDNVSFPTILYTVYPEPFAKKVCDFINMLYIITKNQTANEDYIGRDIFLEDSILGTNV